MFPIYERTNRDVPGLSFIEFAKRYDEIFSQHLATGRAKAFAFVFFDVDDIEFSNVVNDRWNFVELDRLAGHDLTVFYVHGRGRGARVEFNNTFLPLLELEEEAQLPCIVFFKFEEGEISDIQVGQLEGATEPERFRSLYRAMESYLKTEIDLSSRAAKGVRWFKSGVKVIASQAFQAALSHYFGTLF